MSEKVLGYILLGFGILVILFAVVNTYWVFAGISNPVQIVDPNSPLIFNLTLPSDRGIPMEVPINLGESLPFFALTNKIFHIILMGFIVSAAAKVAMIGVNLVRPIVVKAKSE